ncbi:uncharacterized protein LOC131930815 [Physella acuta]|uniref:uncharacterized protein LOC131930815 n=1 Tax=Physella acuta TaxID=109671 RepID=UPI0027DD5977|nr:uncharacterized protein LOC131930815 [Physella acuta]
MAVLASRVSPQSNNKCRRNHIFEFTFLKEVYVTSLQIRYLYKDERAKITLIYTTADHGDWVCDQQLTYDLDDLNMVVECKTITAAKTFTVKFDEDIYVCKIHINGGRNIARGGFSSIIVNGVVTESDINDRMVIDQIVKDDCYVKHLPDSKITWVTEFYMPPTVVEVLVYTADQDGQKMSDFTIDIEADEEAEDVNYKSQKFQNVHSVLVRPPRKIRKIEITTTGTLVLCELQVYGECGIGMFGPECDYECYETCLDQDCQFMGICKACPKGRTGQNCMKLVSPPSNSLNESGQDFRPLLQSANGENSGSALNWGRMIGILTLMFFVLALILVLRKSRTTVPAPPIE